jgi:hypothetical protein
MRTLGTDIGSRIGSHLGSRGGSDAIPGVSRDADSDVYVPEDATEWDALLAAAALSQGAPSAAWLLQESGSPMAAAIGAGTQQLLEATTFGTLTYQVDVPGWARTAVTMSDGGILNERNNGSVTNLNLGTTSALTLLYCYRTGAAADLRIIVGMGGAIYANIVSAWLDASNHLRVGTGTTPTDDGTVDYGANTVFPLLLQHDVTGSVTRILTHEEVVTFPFAAVANEAGQYFLGTLGGVGSGPVGYAYAALWTGADAEMSTDDIRDLLTTLGWTVAW